jgi:thioredoxin 1
MLPYTTDDAFQADVLEADLPVLVDFTASWCGPCRIMKPVLEELATDRDDLRIVALDLDENQATAARYGVLAAPTMILFRHGEPVLTLQGAPPRRRLEAELASAA